MAQYQEEEGSTGQLMWEAKIMQSKVPGRSLEEIYAYLEANIDAKNRFQLVLDEFRRHEQLDNARDEEKEDQATTSVIEQHDSPEMTSGNDQAENSVSRKRKRSKSDTGLATKRDKRNDGEEFSVLEEMEVVEQTAPETAETESEESKELQFLQDMFPHVRPSYLRRRCATITDTTGYYQLAADLLDKRIGKGVFRSGKHVDLRKQEETSQGVPASELGPALEEQFQILIHMFPQVDPDYLRSASSRCNGSEEEFQKLVTEILENKSYPLLKERKRLETEAKKIDDTRQKLLGKFDLQSFLQEFPDPPSHFSDVRRVPSPTYQQEALSYLKAKYRGIFVRAIVEKFRENNHLLYPTAKSLDALKGDRLKATRKKKWVCPTNIEIPLLQEITFNENKEEIDKHFKVKEEARRNDIAKARAANELLECGCCFDDECLVEDMAECEDGHPFCKVCVKRGAEEQIGQSKTHFPCFRPNCESEFNLKTLKMVLKSSTYERVFQQRQLDEVKLAGIEGLEMCPFCNFALILPPEDKVFKCQNPNCMRESCRLCGEENHVPLRCDELEKSSQVKMRTYIEEKMTESLLRKCYKCDKKFIKVEGCHHVSCPCGATMCYQCRRPIGQCKSRCGFESSSVLHAREVKEGAVAAKEKVTAENPGVELLHDPTKLLPENKPLARKIQPWDHARNVRPWAHPRVRVTVLGQPREYKVPNRYPNHI